MDKYQKTIATFNEVAEQYWDKFKSFKLYEPTYDWFCEYLPQSRPDQLPEAQIDLLEIACGPGNVSRYLLDKNPDINLIGVDLAANMIELAKTHNPKANYQVLDCRQIMNLEQPFDAIMCGFCIPYISWQDSQTLIQNMAALLKTDGLLYLSTTAGLKSDEGFKGSNSAAGAVYVHYHAIDDIIKSLVMAGLTIIDRKKITHQHNQQTTDDIFILASKSA